MAALPYHTATVKLPHIVEKYVPTSQGGRWLSDRYPTITIPYIIAPSSNSQFLYPTIPRHLQALYKKPISNGIPALHPHISEDPTFFLPLPSPSYLIVVYMQVQHHHHAPLGNLRQSPRAGWPTHATHPACAPPHQHTKHTPPASHRRRWRWARRREGRRWGNWVSIQRAYMPRGGTEGCEGRVGGKVGSALVSLSRV